MPDYKLSYFDIDGGRGEVARIAFHIAGVDFTDNRLSFPEFGEARGAMRFNAVPVLEIDGEEISQSDAICRYIGRMADLYPTDPLQALYCDEVMGAFEDLTHFIVRTFGLEGDELIEARQKLVDGKMTVFLKGVQELLHRGGGEYFAGNQLSVADLRSFVQVRSLSAGKLDHVPADIIKTVAPDLLEHHNRVAAESGVAAYYSERQQAS